MFYTMVLVTMHMYTYTHRYNCTRIAIFHIKKQDMIEHVERVTHQKKKKNSFVVKI